MVGRERMGPPAEAYKDAVAQLKGIRSASPQIFEVSQGDHHPEHPEKIFHAWTHASWPVHTATGEKLPFSQREGAFTAFSNAISQMYQVEPQDVRRGIDIGKEINVGKSEGRLEQDPRDELADLLEKEFPEEPTGEKRMAGMIGMTAGFMFWEQERVRNAAESVVELFGLAGDVKKEFAHNAKFLPEKWNSIVNAVEATQGVRPFTRNDAEIAFAKSASVLLECDPELIHQGIDKAYSIIEVNKGKDISELESEILASIGRGDKLTQQVHAEETGAQFVLVTAQNKK